MKRLIFVPSSRGQNTANPGSPFDPHLMIGDAMKSPKGIVGLILAIVALAGVPTPTWAGETEFAPARLHGTRIHHRVEVFYWRDRRFDRQYYPALTFRGGWYALNYPYYWGYGPAVGYYDPYDANGNYFPHPLPRR